MSSTQFLVLIPISLRSIQILSFHLLLGLPEGLFSCRFTSKIFKALLSLSILATWPAHLNFLDLITLLTFGKRYKYGNSLWTLHSPFVSLLGPNIRKRILLSNTLSLHSSINVRDHVSQPYSTTDNIIVLYIRISIFNFLERSRENKSVWTE